MKPFLISMVALMGTLCARSPAIQYDETSVAATGQKKHLAREDDVQLCTDIMALGQRYWELLRVDPYINQPVRESLSLHQEQAALRKSVVFLKKEKAELDEQYALLQVRADQVESHKMRNMMRQLEPSRTMCVRAIREYERNINVIQAVITQSKTIPKASLRS